MLDLKYHLLTITAGAACAALLAVSPPAAAQAADAPGTTLTQEKVQTEALLDKLAERENQLLSSAAKAEGEVAAPEGDAASLKARLGEALTAKRALERQQESFISEIMKLRQKIKQLEVQAQKVQEETFEYREQELKDELRSAHGRAERLERELAEERERDREARKYKAVSSNLSDELTGERRRLALKDKSISELQQQIDVARQAMAERDELKRNYTKAKQRNEQLELELQARKSLEQDNLYLREELKKAQQGLTAGVAAKRQAAELSTAGKQHEQTIETLTREKSEAEAKLAAQEQKIQLVAEKIQQLGKQNEELVGQVEALRKDLEDKNEVIAKSNGFGNDLKRIHGQLAETEALLRKTKEERDALHGELAALKTQHEQLISAQESTEKQLSELKTASSAKDEELTSVKRQLSKTIEETRLCQLSVEDKQNLAGKLPELEAQVVAVKNELAASQEQYQSCTQELTQAKNVAASLPNLQKELLAAKSELLLYQTEQQVVGRKSPGSDKDRRVRQVRERAALLRAQQSGAAAPAKDTILLEQGKIAAAEEVGPRAPAPPLSDVMLLEVKAAKVNLRSGPGEEHSPVMQLQRKSRLTVEDREGDWYRVFTPHGARAYIHKDVVRVLNEPAAAAAAASAAPAPRVVPPAPRRGPNVPAARAIRNPAVIPFGKTGAPGSDVEAAALERLRSGFGQIGAPAPGGEE